jgi:tRNA (cytidine32/uridine32-2'-O)-methyltransferase
MPRGWPGGPGETPLRVQVILVRPRHAENVGATARAIRNTGLAGLSLVDPGDFRTVECWRTAWGAHEVLEEVQVFESLDDALRDTGYSAAFSGQRSPERPVIDVREMAAEVAAGGPDHPAALVFGPESSGLSGHELSLCGRRVRIPTHPTQPSLNLSHAVAIAGYELLRAGQARPRPAPRRATHAEKEHLLVLLRAGLAAIGALPPAHAEHAVGAWQRLVRRADLTPRELRLLEHLARKMLQVGQRGDG